MSKPTPHTQGEEKKECPCDMHGAFDDKNHSYSDCPYHQPTPTQEPIEKNILNDPNGTVDKMQKELEQQAKAHQPSEGWREEITQILIEGIHPGFEFVDALSVEPLAKRLKSFIRTLLATARREESELWMNAVCSVVDAETLEKIREVMWRQEKELLTKKGT